jgi:hypothetical protein
MTKGGDRMKRDMEFVRKLLIDISNGKCKTEFTRDSDEDKKYVYHLQIMKQAGLIDFEPVEYKSGMSLFDIPLLTWEGNDYLDAISNDSVWDKTKKVLTEKGLELSEIPFQVLKAYASMQIKQLLGMD